MKQLASANPNQAIFRDDWGVVWRVIGWVAVGFGALAIIGSLLPQKAGAEASATPPVASAIAGTVAMLLGGWFLCRRYIVLDRREAAISIRRGIGPLAMRQIGRAGEFTHIDIGVSRDESTSRVSYRVFAAGPAGELTLANFHHDELFDSPEDSRQFAATVASFLGLPLTDRAQTPAAQS